MLEVNNLRKRYGDVQAVDGATFRVENDQCVGLLGPNGAGKTTTVSMICGLIAPDSGTETGVWHPRIGLVILRIRCATDEIVDHTRIGKPRASCRRCFKQKCVCFSAFAAVDYTIVH
jgi:ABC-type branched-subunit amino acid transport system ATPase component